jgi:hypothetical protein
VKKDVLAACERAPFSAERSCKYAHGASENPSHTRRTELRVLVAPGQTAVGLHCCNLDITEVLVDGEAAQVCRCLC